MITPAADAMTTIFQVFGGQELCACSTSLTGSETAQCIFDQLVCNSDFQITLTRT